MHVFDKDTMLSETAPSGLQRSHIRNWLINKNPNGGYLMAILARAMMDKSEKKSTPILTANYISRCRLGKITVRIEEISVSRQFSRYEARLFQDGAEKSARSVPLRMERMTVRSTGMNHRRHSLRFGMTVSECRRFRDSRYLTTSSCCSIRHARDGYRENWSKPPRTGGGSVSGRRVSTISFLFCRS